MTIDEAIKRYTNNAEYERTHDNLQGCLDFKQLAEWLRELKKLREIPNNLVPKYRDGIQDEYDRGANEMLEEVIDDIRKYMEEVNADAVND